MDNKQVEQNQQEQKENKKSIFTIAVSVFSLLLLIILSIVIIVTRLAVSLPNTDDSFVINPEFDTVEFDWGIETEVAIFRVREVDENGNVLVESLDGNNIIAPGMEGDYVFEIRNLGKFAVDTKVIVNGMLKVNGEVFDNVPIEMRLSNYMGETINGDWNRVDEVSSYYDECVIGKKSYVYYTLDWRWNYEGDDELDTLLGNLSVDNDVEFTVNIVASATRCGDRNADGGLLLPDDFFARLFDIIPLIIINIIAFIIIVIILARDSNKRKKENRKIRLRSR